MFHDTTAESSDLYNCKQKDREPLQNFVRSFMQQRSQIPEANDKTMIKALIKRSDSRTNGFASDAKETQNSRRTFS
jgi:hypothetical protein